MIFIEWMLGFEPQLCRFRHAYIEPIMESLP
jgi:hypothetical protein